MKKIDIVKQYLDDFPNLPNLTLSKKIYNDYPAVFTSIDCIRTYIRELKGLLGEKHLKKRNNTKYFTKEKLQEKYNLPDAIEETYEPYYIKGDRGLIFSDIHIPFHDKDALSIMFDYTSNIKFDFILIDGDLLDCYSLSNFDKIPDITRFPEDIEKTKQFFDILKKIYPNSRIYFKKGNHEKWFEQYLKRKAPELWGINEFRLDIILDCYNKKINNIEESIYIDISGLSIIHGHEYHKAVSSPANPARTLFLRTKATALCGHYHQTSEHTEPTINDKMITCWSIGCMCRLHPEWMPLNKWNHGFAIYERFDNNFWTIQNKRILLGKVV